VSWSRRFEEPIELPDGRKLKTLAEAMSWLAKEIPKSEHKMEKVQTAAHLVTRAAEHGGPRSTDLRYCGWQPFMCARPPEEGTFRQMVHWLSSGGTGKPAVAFESRTA
jgi:hypothetical protein